MDTYFHIDSWKCSHCYKCIYTCMELKGDLGMLTLGYKGTPHYWFDNCQCHHCSAKINLETKELDEENGQLVSYVCDHICPTGAIEIERW